MENVIDGNHRLVRRFADKFGTFRYAAVKVPSIKNGEIPSKHFCEFVRAAEKVGYRRGVPARASRGPNAAFVERPRDRFERCCASTRLNVLV